MKLYPLDKKVLILKGNPEQFLNGLTSNTLDVSSNAFLNMHGRIIATFDQLRLSENEFLLVIAAKAESALKSHVERYLKINRSTLEDTNFKVYFDVEGSAQVMQGDYLITQSHGCLIITRKDYPAMIAENEFTLFRLQHHIPLHGVDYHDEMLLNVHEHDYVSYTKGCFLGQEMVAKVHNRSKPSWALKVKYQDELPMAEQSKMTSAVLDPQTNRVFGFIFQPHT